MSFTLKIKDEQLLKQIESLRGEKSAVEFAQAALAAGVMLAAQPKNAQKKMAFAGAKAEFKSLDDAAVTAALKQQDKTNPVVAEVNRLVNAYAVQLKQLAQANGNRLPSQLRVQTKSAIEKIAFQITAQAIKGAKAQAQKDAKKTA
jgi:hypothetical protein